MNIQILQLIEGAKAARGLTVIIDVFRAFFCGSLSVCTGGGDDHSRGGCPI